MNYLKRPFLVLSLVFLLFIVLNLSDFLGNVWFYVSGSVSALFITKEWGFALLNIAVFLSLLLFIGRRNIDWKTHGLFSAFIISLFVEMYGISLFYYFIEGLIGVPKTAQTNHEILFDLNLFGITLGFDFWMTFGSIVIITGILIIMIGWYQLYSSRKPLYTNGFYKYSRHPQYVGFLYVVWGWMIAWPTFTTLLFAPVLTWAYLNGAKKEEEFMIKESKDYLEYKKKTPFLV